MNKILILSGSTILFIILLILVLNYFIFSKWVLVDSSLIHKFSIFIGSGVLLGIMVSISGLLLGASVPDENAGDAAILLFFWGGGIGFLVGFIESIVVYFIIRIFK